MPLDALQTLLDNGLDRDKIEPICDDLLEADGDNRAAVLLVHFLDKRAEPDDISDESNGYQSNCFGFGGGEYLVLTDDEADEVAAEYILSSLWAFRPSFLSGETGLPEEVFSALSKQCEGANDAVEALIKGSCGLSDFISEAVAADGRGHFIATYDGEESEVVLGGECYYVYRVN